MFFTSFQANTATVSSEGEHIAVSNVSTAIVSSGCQAYSSQDVQTSTTLATATIMENQGVSTALVWCKGNYDVQLTPFFPPDHFKYYFGENAIQTGTAIIIQKSDLTGLTPDANNTAESILVGLFNKALAGKNIVEFPGITWQYWRTYLEEGKRNDILLIDTRNKLTITNTYELPDVSTVVDPDSY